MRPRGLWVSFLFLAYTALTVVFTYPLAWHFSTHHVGEAGGDAKIYLWNYWWVTRALAEGASPFWTDAIFHPIGVGLAFHTLAPLQGAVFGVGRAVLGDVAAANAIVVWTFVASALATYALAREMGAERRGAFIAGVVFAFCPYRLARLAGHYDLLGTEWIPLFILLLSRSEKRRWLAAAAGVVLACAAYTAATYAVFLALFTVLLVAFRPRLWTRAAVSAVVAMLLLTPVLVQAARDLDAWTYPPYPGTDRYAATLAGYVTPPSTETEGAPPNANRTESTVFLGYTVVALGLLGAARWRSSPALPFWLTASAVFLVLSLGGPLFDAVRAIPLLENLRAPARLSVLVSLSLAVVAALALRGKGVPLGDSVLSDEEETLRAEEPLGSSRELAARGWKAAQTGYPFLLTPLLVMEFLAVPIPLFRDQMPAVYGRLAAAEEDELVVVEIPGIEQSPTEVMYHQTVHGKPIFVGTAARVPREKADYYMGLPLVRTLIDLRKGRVALTDELVAREHAPAPAVARFLGLGYFVVDKAYEKRGVVDFVERVLPVSRWYEDDERVVLMTRRDALPPDPIVVDAGSLESRQHFESGWERSEREGRSAFRWANRERSTLLFRRPAGATTVVLELSPLESDGPAVELTVDEARIALAPGWQDVRLALALGPGDDARSAHGGVERVTLEWSALRRPSASDPRRLAARIRRFRFE